MQNIKNDSFFSKFMKVKDYIEINGDKGYLKVKITPKSRKTELFDLLGENTLKIRIKSPPEKWKANKELIDFLSKDLSIDKDKIKIISWLVDQSKLIRIDL